MSFNLLELVKNFFTSEFVTRASSNLGENPSGIGKALSAIIPTALTAILKKATSSQEGAGEVFEMAKSASGTVTGTSDLTSTENINKGRNLLVNLFTGSPTAITGSISTFSGIKESSASSLMIMVLPAVMGILGHQTDENNLSASGLAGFLSSQQENIMNAIPPGMPSLPELMKSDSLFISETSKPEATAEGKQAMNSGPDKTKKGPKWLIPLIVILVVLGLLWYFSRSCNQTRPSPATNIDRTSMR